MDDWSKLDILHKKYDSLIISIAKSKKIFGLFASGAFLIVSSLGCAVVADSNYRKAKQDKQIALDEYVVNTKQELTEKYYAVEKYLSDHPDEVVDDTNFGDFLFKVYDCEDFRDIIEEGYTDKGAHYYVEKIKPEYKDFIDMYGGDPRYGFKNGYGFEYITDTISSMKDDIANYTLADSLGDTLTVPTGLGAGLGAVAVVMFSYGLTRYRYKKQKDYLRSEIDKLEDKLFYKKL